MKSFGVISINDNVLRLSVDPSKDNGFKGLRRTLDSLDTQNLIQNISEMLSELSDSKKDITLHFLVPSNQTHLRFITTRKNSDLSQEGIISEIKAKLSNIDLETLYFDYQKIAPFVYQFVGVPKILLEQCIEISNALKLELKTVVPQNLCFVKSVNSSEAGIYLDRHDDKIYISVAELNGIYFSEDFDINSADFDLENLLQALASYERTTPIKKVFSLGNLGLRVPDEFDFYPVNLGLEYEDPNMDFKAHVLFEKFYSNSDVIDSHLNLLSLLPLPVEAKNNSIMVYAGVGSAALLLVLSIGLGGYFFFNSNTPTLPSDTPVLGNQAEATESTESTSTIEEPKINETSQIDRSQIRIRVENGTSISGLAAGTREDLEKLGYKVSSIGDSNESDRLSTLVRLNETSLKYKSILMQDLSKLYDLVFVEDLPQDLEYDVLIVRGSSESSALPNE